MSGRSVQDAMKRESKALKKKILSINLGKLYYKCGDVETLTIQPYGIKTAVHVQYIEGDIY